MERGKPNWICAKHGRMAPELLLVWTEGQGLPVDMEAVMDALGVIVARDELAPYRSVLAVSGVRAGVLVDQALSAEEARFAIAHAVGHLVLHDGVEFRERDFESTDDLDVEANLYAARLLLPENALREALAVDPQVHALAARFGVSKGMVAARIRQLVGAPIAHD